MSDNRTTEKLCKLLRERGVEYTTNDDERAYDEPAKTTWDFVLCGYEMTVTATEFVDVEGKTYLEMDFHHAFTPEQAIAATLGRPKVKKVRGMTYNEHGGEVYYLACSGCGEWIDGDLDCIGEADGPNFCDHCGGEFDGPLLCKVCGELADMEFGDMCAECYWHEGEGNDER